MAWTFDLNKMNDIKKIGVLGTRGTVNNCAFLSTDKFLSAVGMNSGNLLFQYAVFKSIRDDKIVVGEDIPWSVDLVRATCRVLVVPSANFIREDFDLTEYVDFLVSCNLPVLFLGIGVQADSYDDVDLNLHPSIYSLINFIADQGIDVGVRGEFTASFLKKNGIKNITVIGCPSNFINTDSLLHEKLTAKWAGESTSVSVTGDEPWPKSKKKLIAERKVFDLAYSNGGVYVQQSVAPFVSVLRMNNPYSGYSVREGLADSIRDSIAPDLSSIEFRRFLASSVRIYISVEQWLEDMSRFDFSVGLRMHGNMVPHQSGCPAVWITHDARTRELVETMSLPSLDLDQFIATDGLHDLKNSVDPRYTEYGVKRLSLLNAYIALLKKFDISCTFDA